MAFASRRLENRPLNPLRKRIGTLVDWFTKNWILFFSRNIPVGWKYYSAVSVRKHKIYSDIKWDSKSVVYKHSGIGSPSYDVLYFKTKNIRVVLVFRLEKLCIPSASSVKYWKPPVKKLELIRGTARPILQIRQKFGYLLPDRDRRGKNQQNMCKTILSNTVYKQLSITLLFYDCTQRRAHNSSINEPTPTNTKIVRFY